MDEVAAGGVVPRGLADDLWRLIYTRGHCDVDKARPYRDRHHAGILVYSHDLDAQRSLVVIETGERLVGAVAAFGPLPRLGSAVRLAAGRLVVDEAFPLDIEVRFDRPPANRGERRWIGVMRDALGAIRTAEAVRRDGIAARRRTLPALTQIPAENTLRERIGALRTGGAGVNTVRIELPELRKRLRDMQTANAATCHELRRLEEAHIESRARTQAAFTAATRLD
ncbi:MAG TPA: hypothetical protein VHS78_17620, partial [Candidatus Elarobacter sp.]|nr:hypothetical protein [Candidatus Elarobacter sp.]